MAGCHRKCTICGFQEKHSNEKRFFARFPLDKHRCAKWLKVVGKEDLAYLPIEKLHDLQYVCEIHFTKRNFTKTKTRLKKDVVPTLQLSSSPPLADHIIAEFLRLNSHVAVPSKGQIPVPANIAPAASSAVSEESAAVASISLLGSTPVVHVSAAYRQRLTAVPSTSCQESPSGVPSTSREGQTPSTSQQDNVQIHMTEPKQEDQCLTADVTGQSYSQQSPHSVVVPPMIQEVQIAQQNQCELDASPKHKKLLAQLKKTKSTLASLKKSAKSIESLSSPFLKEIVMSALKNQRRKPQGKRWSHDNKMSALEIYKKSPDAYRYLQEVMPLPTIKTLETLLKKNQTEPGIS